jgi:hypothetical protein
VDFSRVRRLRKQAPCGALPSRYFLRAPPSRASRAWPPVLVPPAHSSGHPPKKLLKQLPQPLPLATPDFGQSGRVASPDAIPFPLKTGKERLLCDQYLCLVLRSSQNNYAFAPQKATQQPSNRSGDREEGSRLFIALSGPLRGKWRAGAGSAPVLSCRRAFEGLGSSLSPSGVHRA